MKRSSMIARKVELNTHRRIIELYLTRKRCLLKEPGLEKAVKNESESIVFL